MINILNPDYETRIKKFLERQYFMKHINFDLGVIKPGATEGSLTIEELHLQQKGFLHGGVIATVADITMGFAAYTVVPESHHVVTGDLRISYLNPGMGDTLTAKGYVIKQGRKINFCESEIYTIKDDVKTRVAKASASMVTIFPEEVIK